MATVEDKDTIPVIDLSCKDRQITIDKLRDAFETIGFAHLINVPNYTSEDESKLLTATKWFYRLPLEEKLKYGPKRWNKDSTTRYRGYYPAQVGPGREQYFIGKTWPGAEKETSDGSYLQEDTPLPDNEFFREVFGSLFDVMLAVGLDVTRMLCAGLGWDEHTYDDRFHPMSLSTYKPQRYQSFEESKLDRELACGAHADVGFLTFLTTFSYTGLEVLRRDGTWIPIASSPGTLILNLGDLMARLSNGRYVATQHRVKELGIERYSAPFFLEARSDAKFELPDTGEVITYGPWLMEGLNRYSDDYGDGVI